MTVFEHAGRLLIVDCGVLFPEPDQPGVDLILPDFSYLEGRLEQVEAVVLTHAHEDHIGALPYLLRLRPDLPLVGSRLTLALVASKLTEHRLTPEAREVSEGTRGAFGPFDLEFFAVNHSIPDALAVAIPPRPGPGRRAGAGLSAGPVGPRRGDRGVAGRRGDAAGADRPDLHRVAGRADVRAGPDGRARSPDPDRRGRHGDSRLVAGAGERDRGVPDHQRADPPGRAGGAPAQRAGTRVPARARRRAAVRAEPDPAEQFHPGARRVAAPEGARRAGRADRRAPRAHRHCRGPGGRRPVGPPGLGHVQGAVRLRERRPAVPGRGDLC